MKKTIYLLMLFLILFMSLLATENISEKKELGLRKSTVTSDLWVDVNRMNGVFRNNGTWFYDNILGDWGLEWPKGSGLSPIFGAGQFLGASVDGTVKVAASYHNHTEFQAGQIIDGVATNPLESEYRWYVIEPDDVGDWDSWPFHQGAPALKAADGSDSLDSDGNKIPKLFGDITAYCVFNDYAEHAEFATPKLGAEIGMTLWAFNRADAIGDMIFIKWTLINKSSDTWDETYFAIWSDPDVGDGWDDFVGCDTVLGLGYCYNATDDDQNYGVAPPAVGIDFFQGPIVDSPGDEVNLPDGTVLTDKKMLKMTSFIYYNNDDSNQGNPQTGGDVWNYLRGYWRDGNPITFGGTGTDPNADPAPFMFSGNPETGEGWLDTDESDRRFMMTTGPYPNEPWSDTDGDGIAEFGEPGVQEIVAGAMVGRGSSNLNSVTFLKAIDEIAQLAYDIDFALPASPKQPVLTKSENDGVALVTWDDRSEYLDEAKTEPYEVEDIVANGLIGQMIVVDGEYKEVTDGTYNFTGYTVYQYTDSSGSDAVEYAVLGVEEIGDATPYTDARMIRIETNLNPKVGNVGDALVNGQTYYFGVAANSYCKFADPQVFSSAATYISVTPQKKPGERYSCEYGDTLDVTYTPIDATAPAGDGYITAIVADPSKTTGDEYKVVFEDFADETVWHLIDLTTGDTVLAKQTNQRNDEAYTVVDGLIVKVAGPASGIKEIVEIDPTTGEVYDTNLFGSLNNYGRSQEWPVFYIQDDNGDFDLTRIDRFEGMTPKDYEIVFTDDDSTLAWDYQTDVVLKDTLTGKPCFLPFVLTRIDLDGTRTRLPITILDGDGDGKWSRNREGYWSPGAAFELLYVYDNQAYDPTDVATYISTDDGTAAPGYGPWGAHYPAINRFQFSMYSDLDGYATADMLDENGFFYGPPAAGTTVRINTNKPNTPNDVFTFTAPDAKTVNKADLKEDIKKISVVPNPYYGYHKNEANIFARWVQFNNLPANQKVTIKIFDLAGNRIRTLDKPEDSSTILQYDLKNEYELPIASGIYVYHVDIKGIGEKIGKMAVFAPNERLDTY